MGAKKVLILVLVLAIGMSGCSKKVNIPDLLQQYEAGIDELIPVMEALLAGDIYQQPRLETISKKLTPVVEALEKNQSKMTEEEKTEYIRISLKLASIEEAE